MCPLARTRVLLMKNMYEYILNFFTKMIIFITIKAFLKLQSIQLTFKLAYQKHLRGDIATELKYRYSGQWTLPPNCSTDTMGTARSVMTLLLDFLARLQRLPLTLQTPRLRIPPTETLHQVTLNQDLSVIIEKYGQQIKKISIVLHWNLETRVSWGGSGF